MRSILEYVGKSNIIVVLGLQNLPILFIFPVKKSFSIVTLDLRDFDLL